MFELCQLEQLLAVKEYGTISAAAEKLLLSQPALSRSMQKLESELGVELFDRSKNKIELNDNGLLAVECAEKVIYDANTMVQRIKSYERSKRTISIGSCAPAPLWSFSSFVSGIYPDFAITTELKNKNEVMEGLGEGIYHIAIMPEEIKDENYLCFRYCKEHLMVSLPPAHPLSMYKKISFADLEGETMLLFSEIGFWHDVCNEKMPKTNFIIQHERGAFQSLIRASSLPCFTSDLVRSDLEENRIVIPITDKEANPTFFYIIKKKDKSKFTKLIQADF